MAQASPPTGVVTFLLSDVEDSTRLWEEDRDGMAASLTLHDRLLRDAVSEMNGYVFSTAGDAFAVAFHTPDDALAAALAIQRGLAAADWPGPHLRVRIGIHAGTADERDGDYFGPTVNRTARIMSLGRGGHVLASGTVAGMARTDGSNGALVAQGEYRLSGIDRPEPVFQLQHPTLAVPEGGLRGVSTRSNLPEALSSFVGRTEELTRIERHLETGRLVVLTGPGGAGKTRLATEVGRRRLAANGAEVWMVELASVTDPSMVMTAIGEVFGLRPGESMTIDEVVVRHLSSQRLLLIVDNCEHVLESAASAAREILQHAAGVRILATSRESLGVDGEVVVNVGALPIPDGAAETDAVRLFLDRARATLGEFDPNSTDRNAIARICRSVEGIPLGIELAAARLRSLAPTELADRLDASLSVLASKSVSGRHRTLEATIDWSYDLLDESEKALFRRLSVFVTGFDLEAASAIAGEPDVLDVVESLVDKSLVQSVRTFHGMRFRMLEPVRQYAGDRLGAAGEADAAADDHAEFFVRWVAEAAPHTRTFDQSEWYLRIDEVYDDVRAAFRRLLDRERYDEYLRMAFDLFQYWVQTGFQLEGIETLLTVLDRDAGDVESRVKGWFVTAVIGAQLTSLAAIDHARRGLELAGSSGDPSATGRMALALGAAIRHATTDPEYLEHLHQARRILDEGLEPHWWEQPWDRAMVNLLFAGYLPADDPRSEEHGEIAMTSFERVGDRSNVGATLLETSLSSDTHRMIGRLRQAVGVFDEVRGVQWQAHARMILGTVLGLEGQAEEAAIHLAEAAEQLDDLGDLSCWANATRWLVRCEAALGMGDESSAKMLELLDRFDRLPMQEVALPRTVDALAVSLAARGAFEEAALVLGCAEEIPFDVATVVPRDHREVIAVLEGSLGADRLHLLRAQGAKMEPKEALARAREWLSV